MFSYEKFGIYSLCILSGGSGGTSFDSALFCFLFCTPGCIGSAEEVHHGFTGALAPGAQRGRPVVYKEELSHSEGEDVSATCEVEVALLGHDPV